MSRVSLINHQIKTYPADRADQAYTRPEFVESLTIPVITATALYDAWRRRDFNAIRAAVFGDTPPIGELAVENEPPRPATDLSPHNPTRRRWWRLTAPLTTTLQIPHGAMSVAVQKAHAPSCAISNGNRPSRMTTGSGGWWSQKPALQSVCSPNDISDSNAAEETLAVLDQPTSIASSTWLHPSSSDSSPPWR